MIYLYPNSNHYGENTYTELLWIEEETKFEIIDRDIKIDPNPTSASPNPVSSGGVYTALEGKADKSEMSVTPGTGTDADKTTIKLKNGTTAIVLTRHQDISGKADKIPVANAIPQGGMLPNVLYLLGTIIANTTFPLAPATDNTIANVWMWTFETETKLTISWPPQITAWNGGDPPIIAENYHYEISVLDGVASYIEAPLPVGGGE